MNIYEYIFRKLALIQSTKEKITRYDFTNICKTDMKPYKVLRNGNVMCSFIIRFQRKV